MAGAKKLNYQMRRSVRARRVRIDVHADGRVVVTRPSRVSAASAERFLSQKISWIKKSLLILRRAQTSLGLGYSHATRGRLTSREYTQLREQARTLVEARIAHYNHLYQAPVGRIFIRNQKTRWGSCSQKGNLNFNWRIVHLPQYAADYLIVHELCHLREFNHSEQFWELVGRAVPEYKRIRKELRALPL